ncbi:GH36-type glycosyl hydrolase domain-containing protein [Clostridium rectalis]|uniref:GH36-type glycosyl hydrolase domain-containing protein n=1 Tax=Clostridium rectalis TaxID=2040295 RepID=UPI000F62F0B8|nr:glucoamylase family protein [Clostridium rectalis]
MYYYGIASVLFIISLIIVFYFIWDNKYLDNEDIEFDWIDVKEFHSDEVEESPYNSYRNSIKSKIKLLKSLDRSYKIIINGHDYINKESKAQKEILPAAEWLLDNLYIIQREYKEIKVSMPKNYYNNLPIIQSGAMKGYPRIYYIAKRLVYSTDGKINKENINVFIEEYQKNVILSSGELWALPIMIKIALIQNIGKITSKILYAQKEKNKGEDLADKLIKSMDNEKELDDIYANKYSFNIYFTEKLLRVLRENGVDNPRIYKWIDENLSKEETDSERIIILEHKKQAFFRLIIGNSITGIREISLLNWKECFESLSHLEKILINDPAKVYENMDFQSRDYYRHMVEKIARHMKLGETFVAKKIIECAKENIESQDKAYLSHVGYYLLDQGIECLKRKIGFKDKSFLKLRYKNIKKRINYYINFVLFLTIIISLGIVVVILSKNNNVNIGEYILAYLAVIIPVSQIVVSIINWSINHLVRPTFIPKLEFKGDIPEKFSTMVVIPTLLDSEKRVEELVKDLEVYYLANRSKNIFYAILGDFKDSKHEKEENDEKILSCALKNIKKLNEKYAKEQEIFYFFNRYRQFNDKENLWIGWERKRGKLVEFNKLIRGEKNTSYNTISSDINNLSKVKYIITLDADTKLPRESAKKLIGAMAHVLNEPYIDKNSKKIFRGHGLMQPRISVSIENATKTMFSKVFSGETGIDLYTTAISDVYQDLFDEGIFTGKGIYDIDAFNYMLKNEIPENTVLSHDLLEGSYLRTALITDVELIDGYPAYYNSSAKRLHRWVRGDWQLILWLFKKSPLNKLSKWKIFDNLRRSLLAPSIIILIILALSLLNGSEKWIMVAIISLLAPILFNVSDVVVAPIKGINLSGKIKSWNVAIEQFFLIFCFLPYQCYLMLDAVIRTLYRVFISKKHLLEWQTAADVEATSGRKIKDYISSMWMGSLISIIIVVLAFNASLNIGMIMLPSCVIWFISPYIAYFISKDKLKESEYFTQEQINLLRRISRKTWAYFEDFINEENNYLAPDNFQQDPYKGIAHRTSPTNMGMGLTSNLAAFDLGYIDIIECINRIDNIVKSMNKLEIYKGHFYNWYDTKTKEPLYPRYISTVDSGNLVGYLWVVIEALNEFINSPIINNGFNKGLLDLIYLCDMELVYNGMNNFYDEIIYELEKWDSNINKLKDILQNIQKKVKELDKIKEKDKLYWNVKLKNETDKYLENIFKLFPWVNLLTNKEFVNKLNFNVDNVSRVDILEDLEKVTGTYTLHDVIEKLGEVSEKLSEINKNEYMNKLYEDIIDGRAEVYSLYAKIIGLKNKLQSICNNTDFSILFSKSKGLFSIGYDVDREKMDNCYYDLLASEARQASFIAIAKGEVDQSHWFRLGRALTKVNKRKGLVSWSGTMFEYLMPLLIMKRYSNTLLDETYEFLVEGQKYYSGIKKIPWGISESAFYNFDVNLNYQYKAFGIPKIGLKRGLGNELVVSPYSTVMALQVNKKDAYDNIKNLIEFGLEGRYGLFEAIDFTKERLPKGKDFALIKCFMVHHQGMSLMALDNVLNNNIFQDRFHNVPQVKATELLLQEKVSTSVVYDREENYNYKVVMSDKDVSILRRYNNPLSTYPDTHILSNGSYSVMVTSTGSGYSKNDNIMLYRWREDITNDNTGMFFYIKNLNSNEYWSNTYEPCKYKGEYYEAIFSLDKAEFKRKDGNIDTTTEITVSQEDNAEVRKLTISNKSNSSRIIEITSYCEITLSHYRADLVHPAFGNLFVNTEFLEDPLCVLANRRKRGEDEKEYWVMQTVISDRDIVGNIQYETDRSKFIGRGNDIYKPKIMENNEPLSNTIGAVLDPIISLRVRIKLPPKSSTKVAYVMGMADSKEEVIKLSEKYREWGNINRTFELGLTQSILETRYLGIKSSMANLYQKMASNIIFLNSSMRKREMYIQSIKKGQSALWSYGISGDLPIVLLFIRKEQNIDIITQMLKAHEYWRLKGLKVDLVIFNLQESSYVQNLQDMVRDIVSSSHARDKQNLSGGVYLYNKSTMTKEDIDFIIAIARVVIDSDKGPLKNQIENEESNVFQDNLLQTNVINYDDYSSELEKPKLKYFNDIGGFDMESSNYVIVLDKGKNTPAPWINVISNKKFGFHISESGVAYTWYKNSRENKITTWSNDPVKDGESEALYIRDEESGNIWSLTPKPIRDNNRYIIEHGFGYSSFKHNIHGVNGVYTTFASKDNSVKFGLVKLKNNTNIDRSLSITYYAQLVLGVTPQQTAQYITTYFNDNKKYLYAKNPYNNSFGEYITFLSINGVENICYTGDRKEFIGKGGNIEHPNALKRKTFSNTTGSGLDPCMAINGKINLKPNEEKYIAILLGEDENLDEVNNLIDKYNNIDIIVEELKLIKEHWSEILSNIQVKTPDTTMDLMINGWLMYQVISCRFWARTAFYQSGGAYGFRDQLQDSIAISYIYPEYTREHILYSASRQFNEGDVQHWWHPIVDSGIRTRFSDDLLWLPYVTIAYIENTGDYTILDEIAPYLEDEPLKEGEDERYKISAKSSKVGTIYEHCIKAIDKALKFGQHNIPLMGSGDWNDGMSTVGNKGKGESVWLGWFLYSILDKFVQLCNKKDDNLKGNEYEKLKEFIKESLEENAWDGNWYRRAYFDDGTPLGSSENDECQIDSLSQSWAVISKAAKNSRAKEAMLSAEKYLVKYDKGLVMLLTPAFNKSSLEPGYIKGYVPGVRENGGQYTHAAIWYILALTKIGLNDKAWKIFNMINPINHTRSYLDCERYKVEPYVITADIYAVEPHVGRGGWSWYTGAAGWMYTTAVNGILGLNLKEEKGFTIEPNLPKDWNGYSMKYKRGKCVYNIEVIKGNEDSVYLDGKKIEDNTIPFLKEGLHEVKIVIK